METAERKKSRMALPLFVAVLVFLAFLGFLYGWRLFGFRFCDAPGSLMIKSVEIEENAVHLSGSTCESAKRYDGFVCRVEGDTLYVGVKTGAFFAQSESDAFDLNIPTETAIARVVLKGADEERVIYPA